MSTKRTDTFSHFTIVRNAIAGQYQDELSYGLTGDLDETERGR